MQELSIIQDAIERNKEIRTVRVDQPPAANLLRIEIWLGIRK